MIYNEIVTFLRNFCSKLFEQEMQKIIDYEEKQDAAGLGSGLIRSHSSDWNLYSRNEGKGHRHGTYCV